MMILRNYEKIQKVSTLVVEESLTKEDAISEEISHNQLEITEESISHRENSHQESIAQVSNQIVAFPYREVTVYTLEPSHRIRSEYLSVLEDFQSDIVRINSSQSLSSLECVNGKKHAHHLLDKLCMRSNKLHQQRKLSLSPKTWRFKFKTRNLQRHKAQMDPQQIIGQRNLRYTNPCSSAHVRLLRKRLFQRLGMRNPSHMSRVKVNRMMRWDSGSMLQLIDGDMQPMLMSEMESEEETVIALEKAKTVKDILSTNTKLKCCNSRDFKYKHEEVGMKRLHKQVLYFASLHEQNGDWLRQTKTRNWLQFWQSQYKCVSVNVVGLRQLCSIDTRSANKAVGGLRMFVALDEAITMLRTKFLEGYTMSFAVADFYEQASNNCPTSYELASSLCCNVFSGDITLVGFKIETTSWLRVVCVFGLWGRRLCAQFCMHALIKFHMRACVQEQWAFDRTHFIRWYSARVDKSVYFSVWHCWKNRAETSQSVSGFLWLGLMTAVFFLTDGNELKHTLKIFLWLTKPKFLKAWHFDYKTKTSERETEVPMQHTFTLKCGHIGDLLQDYILGFNEKSEFMMHNITVISAKLPVTFQGRELAADSGIKAMLEQVIQCDNVWEAYTTMTDKLQFNLQQGMNLHEASWHWSPNEMNQLHSPIGFVDALHTGFGEKLHILPAAEMDELHAAIECVIDNITAEQVFDRLFLRQHKSSSIWHRWRRKDWHT